MAVLSKFLPANLRIGKTVDNVVPNNVIQSLTKA